MINSPPIIHKTLTAIGFSALSLFSALPAYALSFNFGWSNDDVNITSNPSAAGTLTAVGTLDINRNAGESFTLADITNINILATNPQGSFTFTSFNDGGGTIAGDGLSASITGNFFTNGGGAGVFFGCETFDCDNSLVRLRTVPPTSGGTSFNVIYNSQANAIASFQLTAATPVPFEFSPALGLGVLGGAWLVSKRFKKKSPKV